MTAMPGLWPTSGEQYPTIAKEQTAKHCQGMLLSISPNRLLGYKYLRWSSLYAQMTNIFIPVSCPIEYHVARNVEYDEFTLR